MHRDFSFFFLSPINRIWYQDLFISQRLIFISFVFSFFKTHWSGFSFNLLSHFKSTFYHFSFIFPSLYFTYVSISLQLMDQRTPQVKKNALMQLFSKRQAQTTPQTKPTKRVKTNQNKQDDPLYKLLSWRDTYEYYIHPKEGTFKVVKEKSITKGDQSNWAQNVQGVFVNIDWESTSMEELTELNLSESLIHNGIVFIWGDKMHIGAIMDYFEKMGFFYVENFIFVLLNRKKIPQRSQKTVSGNKSLLNFFSVTKNEDSGKKKAQQVIEKDYQIGKVQKVSSIFCNEDSTYVKETQKVLYMFRKVAKNEPLELRHQRTSDVYFTIGDSLKIDWKAKEVVYKMIETLLISANYKEKQSLKLVELWGDETKPRKGWVTVAEEAQELTKFQNSQNSSEKDLKQL